MRLALVLLLGGAVPTPLQAQDFDAHTTPVGRLRLQVGPTFASFDRRFGYRLENGAVVEAEEPLGFDLTKDRAGTELLPLLSPLERALREATGDPAASLVIGATRVILEGSSVTLPVRLQLGVLPGVQLGVSVPLVRRRVDVDFRLEPGPANVGLGDATTVRAFLGQLSGALDSTRTRVSERCQSAGENSAECRAGRQLLEWAGTLYAALDASAGLVPLTGSQAAQSFAAAVREIQDGMRAYGVGSFTAALPVASTALDAAGFQRLLVDSAFGIAGAPLESWQSGWELGDVEISAKARLVATPRMDSAGAPRTFAYTGAVEALVRLGTGKLDDPNNFVDLGTGDGQTDIEVAAYSDILLGGRLLASIVARYGVQNSVVVDRRIAPPDRPIAPLSTLHAVEWKPASYRALDVVPKLALTPAVSVGLPYSYFTKGADRYTLADGAAGSPPEDATALPSPDDLARETESTLQRLGVEIRYSAVLGRTRLPFEARAIFQTAAAGRGGRTLRTSSFRVDLRTSVSLWGK